MRGRDVERLLTLAEQVERLRSALQRAEALAAEVERDERVVREAPRLAEAAQGHAPGVEAVARELERQWVEQGPLVAEWQRAVELEQLAALSGDTRREADGVDAARREVEAARLSTREELERLSRRRGEVARALEGAPFELPELPALRGDGRPEAARRDALALLAHLDAVQSVAGEAEEQAREQLDAARAELDQLGQPAQLERRLAELRGELPESVRLPGGTPPSVALRLERAGIRVERS